LGWWLENPLFHVDNASSFSTDSLENIKIDTGFQSLPWILQWFNPQLWFQIDRVRKKNVCMEETKEKYENLSWHVHSILLAEFPGTKWIRVHDSKWILLNRSQQHITQENIIGCHEWKKLLGDEWKVQEKQKIFIMYLLKAKPTDDND
jgi:hypothetical protein